MPLEAVEIKIEPEEKLNSAESTSSKELNELDSKILMFIFHYLHNTNCLYDIQLDAMVSKEISLTSSEPTKQEDIQLDALASKEISLSSSEPTKEVVVGTKKRLASAMVQDEIEPITTASNASSFKTNTRLRNTFVKVFPVFDTEKNIVDVLGNFLYKIDDTKII